MQAYITASGQCLPGPPIGNDRMADFIGHLSDQSNRLGRMVLRQNGIQTRHYAIAEDGSTDWTLAKLGAESARACLAKSEIDSSQIGLLATATTQNDALVPGLASGVHHQLGLPPLEIASLQSVCASAMMALKARRTAGPRRRASRRVGAWSGIFEPLFPPRILSRYGDDAGRRKPSRRCRIPALDLVRRLGRRPRRGSARHATACRCGSTGFRCAPSPTVSRRA